ncbi:MAG TPA: DUF2231 domain-containing protein [Polyangiaceae bacterium]|nr:DUF2231 domain-containing protein [Polyangiaceae bacterium]
MHRRAAGPGNAIHPVLAPAALALLALGTSFDLLAAGHAGALTWLAFWILCAGIAWGTWCAMWGLLDWVCFSRLGDAGVGGIDSFATAIVVGLYALSALLRLDDTAHAPTDAAVALEVAGAALIGMKAWIGRELAACLHDPR